MRQISFLLGKGEPEYRSTPLTFKPPGMETSITLLGGSVYTEPLGKSDLASCAPLRIWRRTGVLGGWKTAPFTVKRPVVMF